MSLETTLNIWQEARDQRRDFFPFMSVRGCSQTLSLFPAVGRTSVKRNLDGNLVPLERKIGKFLSKITCSDHLSPALNDLDQGAIFFVDCLVRMNVAISEKDEGEIALTRPPVEGSVFLQKKSLEIPVKSMDGLKISLPKEAEPRDFISFRPCLKMILRDFSVQTHEWDMKCTWTMEMEEV